MYGSWHCRPNRDRNVPDAGRRGCTWYTTCCNCRYPDTYRIGTRSPGYWSASLREKWSIILISGMLKLWARNKSELDIYRLTGKISVCLGSVFLIMRMISAGYLKVRSMIKMKAWAGHCNPKFLSVYVYTVIHLYARSFKGIEDGKWDRELESVRLSDRDIESRDSLEGEIIMIGVNVTH
jgi:hypothetical protein